jgi:predicted RNA-binding Zn ribbon-like protein
VGGSSCLDFINTTSSWLVPAHDYFSGYADLLIWSRRAELLSPADEAALGLVAASDPQRAILVVDDARRLRETVHQVFSALAKGGEPSTVAARTMVRAYGAAVASAHLTVRREGVQPTWRMDVDLAAPLRSIAYAAGALLFSADAAMVKECDGCGWLYVDRSRNRSRRWCDMATCGSRDKMRRYYGRRRAGRSDGVGHGLPSTSKGARAPR